MADAIRLHDLVMPSFKQMLQALSGQLDKASAQENAEGLMQARLAPDMFPLSAQIKFSCVQAEEAVARIFGDAVEPVIEPASFDEAKALIARTVQRLRALETDPRIIEPTRTLELKLGNGLTFDLNVFEYVRSWAIPQFYFHVIAAYAIMRQQGVDLGKADYVPHMLQFMRQP